VIRCQNRRRHLSHRRSLEVQNGGGYCNCSRGWSRKIASLTYKPRAAMSTFLVAWVVFSLFYKFLRVALAAVAVVAPRRVERYAGDDLAQPARAQACLHGRSWPFRRGGRGHPASELEVGQGGWRRGCRSTSWTPERPDLVIVDPPLDSLLDVLPQDVDL
jgi:hypothetical protein